jgi:hypothetical protein
MGVLAPGSAHARPSADNFPEIFWPTYLQIQLQRSPQPLRSHIRSFATLGQLLKFSHKKLFKKVKNAPSGGQRGSQNFFLPQFFFVCLKAPCKISDPYDNPFWEESKIGGEK